MSRISPTFVKLRQAGRPALMPYLTIGHPSPALTLELVPAVIEAGADLIELGIPFSDPLADGATIQKATHEALQQGTTVELCLQTVAELRRRGVETPLILMGYYNPIFQRGVTRFCEAAAQAGADGLIVPDLPPEEADELREACRDHELDLIFLLAPTSDDTRIRRVVELSSGFIYLVSLTGVTGARDHLPADLEAFVQRVRRMTHLPLAVGFGIGNPDEARRVARVADGVIVGSAIVRRAGESAEPVKAVHDFVLSLRQGLNGG
ncbi:MAG: tryptophan synthase subunit alpha [Anaerolineae bacterium]